MQKIFHFGQTVCMVDLIGVVSAQIIMLAEFGNSIYPWLVWAVANAGTAGLIWPEESRGFLR